MCSVDRLVAEGWQLVDDATNEVRRAAISPGDEIRSLPTVPVEKERSELLKARGPLPEQEQRAVAFEQLRGALEVDVS